MCPKKCIASTFEAGSYQPTIDENACVDCGRCYRVCPGKSADYTKTSAKDIFVGTAIKCLAAQTKDKEILARATSGGAVTTPVKNLLRDKIFDAAFLVDTYNHDEETFTNLYTAESDFTNTPKSRYLTINHSRAVRYMLENPDAKLIPVGSSCFVQGILNVIAQFKLNRDNYFPAGLFCDKTMHYNVWTYFKEMGADKLFFRTKEQSGWPGNVGIETQGKKIFLPRETRMQVKDFFCVERCHYCLDKLNQFADISFGDNYTKTPLPAQEIYKSQNIEERKANYIFSEYKSAAVGYSINKVPPEVAHGLYEEPNHARQYESLLVKQAMGREQLFPKVAVEIWGKKIIP